MQDNSLDETTAGNVKFYEIGYVLLSSIPKEKVAEQVAGLKEILIKAGADITTHGDPELTPLAYTMTKKIHGANHRFDEGYFGWIKFELAAGSIAGVKKALDANESILRYLLMMTVKENTYLGKRAPVYVAATISREASMIAPAETADPSISVTPPIAAADIAEMDKSIDAMVKDA